MAVLALATAIGGGVIRDVLLGYFPPNSLRNVVYVTVVLAVTFIVFVIYNSRYHRNIMGPRSRASYLFARCSWLSILYRNGCLCRVYTISGLAYIHRIAWYHYRCMVVAFCAICWRSACLPY